MSEIGQLVLELKENNEDFELYPTTEEMLRVIYPYIQNDKVLDIGCGTCNFKKYMAKFAQEEADRRNEKERRECREREIEYGRPQYPREFKASDYNKIKKYYVIEKSKILLSKLDSETVCLGTDFENTMLIDKPVSTIFCNPPYSRFEDWTKKIITEGNYIQAFLVIPQRWKDNVDIKNLLELYKTDFDILGNFDFLNAERSARAKVDVVRFKKRKYSDSMSSYNKNEYLKDFEEDAFDMFFDELFGTKSKKEDKFETDYSKFERKLKEKKSQIENELVNSGSSKAEVLTSLYAKEYNTLIEHLKKIMELDESVLETFGFSVGKVKEGLKFQIKNLKISYWKLVFEEFDEITERLTYSSRNELMNSFEELQSIDFTIENIYVLILWVIKNANKHYNSQLVQFFKNLSCEENVKPYKSNTKLFNDENWRYNAENKSHYTLDYRIIMSSPFRTTWSGDFDKNEYQSNRTLKDILTIAKNLGFNTGCIHLPNGYGEKTYIYLNDQDEPFMEYKCYKNGNMHVKFNKEFTKAMNVEVSRLLGWIRTAEDIKKEFPKELAEGAEKYFKQNAYIPLTGNGIKLLTVK